MTRQRQILVTVTYNELGCIIDTKAEPYEEQNLQPTCNQLATSCISRQAAIDALGHMMDTDGFRGGWAVSRANVDCMLRALPSVQPEIIYCKDCKHYNAGFECLIEGYGIERNKNWYCADAERRNDG